MSRLHRTIPVVLALLLVACRGDDHTGPPEVHFGRDICAVCGMIVSDERYAACALIERDGRVEPAAFDDIGCLLRQERSAGSERWIGRWVNDYEQRGWLATDEAIWLHSPRLASPMAYGVAAFSSEAAAEVARERYPGAILDLAELRRRFDAGELTAQPQFMSEVHP